MVSNHTRFNFYKVYSCPYCGSKQFKKDGIHHHKQRYRCNSCKRTFTNLTNTLLTKTKKSDVKWKDFITYLTNDATILANTEYETINKNTVYLWRMKILKSFDYYVSKSILKGTYGLMKYTLIEKKKP